jgi:hypothetical protein
VLIQNGHVLTAVVKPDLHLLMICYHTILLGLARTRPDKAIDNVVAWSIRRNSARCTDSQIGLGLNVMTIPFPSQYALPQELQFMTTPVEFALLGNLAVRTTILRRKLVRDEIWFVLWRSRGSYELIDINR